MNTFKFIKQLILNFLFSIIPKGVSQKFIFSGDFAFMANLPNFEVIPDNIFFVPFKSFIFRHMPPLIVSQITGFRDKNNKKLRGISILCFLTAAQIMENRSFAAHRILQGIQLAEKAGCKIVSLGAFTSIAVRDGLDLLGKTKLGITTGNTYSAVIAIKNLKRALSLKGIKLSDVTVAVVGAGGSVGSGCAKALINNVNKLLLIDIQLKEIRNIFGNQSNIKTKLVLSEKIESIKEADAIIVVTNAVKGIIRKEFLKKNALVIDGAYPPNVSKETILARPDVLVVSSAIAKVPGVDLHFNFGLGKEEVHGCLAEALILSWLGVRNHYALGKVDENNMIEMDEVGSKIGLDAAAFRNLAGYLLGDAK
ncbi:MAG: hypothetical protein WC473_05765 [Patescibacteria group bacterium]|jgi:predicted amino acid dehydrogenase